MGEDQERSEMIDWLRLQIDKDERVACEVDSPGEWDGAHGLRGSGVYVYMGRRVFEGRRGDVEHAALHDPARVLREVQAKRRILEVMVAQIRIADIYAPALRESTAARALAVLRLLAAIYSDRPGYREEWR